MEVDHRCTAVAGIKRSLDLDQAAELSSAQLQRSIKPGHMATADRVPHAERVTDDEHLASQVRCAGGRSDWPHGSRREA